MQQAPGVADEFTGRGPPHPIVFTILYMPFGASGGFVTVALAYLATKSGLTVEQGASLVAISLFPNVWKFFWAPVGDRTLNRKRWFILSTIACSLGLMALATIPLGPSTLTLISIVILITSIAATFNGFAVEGLVAHITPPEDRGRVSGWFQAGNLFGNGVGGGLGLWLLNNMPYPWLAGLILGLSVMACCIPLRFIRNVDRDRGGDSVKQAVVHIGKDMWSMLKSTEGILCAVLCIIPVGTGAAASVLCQAEVAAHWHAGDHEVELVQGFLMGGVSMVGCLVGGYACAKLFNGRTGYAIFGGLMALTTALMAFAPATVALYIAFNIAYAFVTGLCYAAFSAFVLDAIGTGHAATKYNGFASLSNAPITYVGLVLAWVETKWGPENMLLAESGLGVAGVLVFVAVLVIVRRIRPPVSPTP